MTQITIEIPEDKIQAVIDAFASNYNYPEQIKDENGVMIPNPTTKAQFARNIIKSFIKEVYVANQVKSIDEQKKVAINTANQEIDVINVN